MPRNVRPLRQVKPYEFHDNYRYRKYYYENFKGGQAPFLYTVSATGIPAAATSAAGQGTTFKVITPTGRFWEMFTTTDQAVLPIPTAGSGWNIACDLVNNEALELVPGGNSSSSRLAFTIGTDTDFFFKAKFKLTDADGSDQFGIGFRKQEAFAVPTSFLTTGDGIYTDFALLGFAGTVANPNGVRTSTDLNNGGSSTVTALNFTWADGLVHELQIRVIGGRAHYLINGIRAGNPIAKDGDGGSITSQSTTSAASFTFDSTDTVVPFIFLRHDTNVSESHFLQEIEIGHLVDVGLDPANE